MTGCERAVMPQQIAPPSMFLHSAPRQRGRNGERGGGWEDGLPRSRVHLSHSFLFILLVCLAFFFSLIFNTPPPSSLLLPSSTHFHFALFHPLPTLYSSPCLPREKRFCLLLVSAPSQSAFLISSYCFCLIFKCYPRPNGNPYEKKQGVSGERDTGWVLYFTAGHYDKRPPPLPSFRERFGGFWGKDG